MVPSTSTTGRPFTRSPAARRLDELVLAERVKLLYARATVAQATVVVNAVVVAAVFWPRASHARTVAWVATLTALALARLVAVRAHAARLREPAEAAWWARLFTAGAFLTGILWGAAALLFYVPVSPAHQIFVAFVLGGMAAGAASSNASHPPAFVAFALPALAPMIARLAGERDPIHLAMAFMLALFGVAVAAISRTGGRAVEDAIRLRFRNEVLVEDLSAAQERLERLNVRLEQRVLERTSELERALERRKESEARLARFRALLDQASDAILVARAGDLDVVDVNEGACRLLGVPAEAIVGQRLHELGIVPALSGAAGQAAIRALPPSEARTVEGVRWRDGVGARSLEISVALRELEGERYALLVARDVSERKELERQVSQSGLLATMGSLAAGVAHEVNNPLASVMANLAFLKERLDALAAIAPEERAALHEALGESLEAAGRVRRVVRDLASLSPRAAKERCAVDLHAVLDTCLEVVAGELHPRAELVRDLGAVPPVLGDRSRLAQIFLNVLLNAAHAIPEGSRRDHRVTIRTRHLAGEGMVQLDVEDTGVGIAAADLDRVFDPYFTTRPFGQGSGLGLSICHGLVTALGGTIAVRSREGAGTTVSVTLPAASPSA
jgi:two-component system NtrC family sensor kinase